MTIDKCLACNASCRTCETSATNCKSCPGNEWLNATGANGVCVAGEANCPGGSKKDTELK